MKRITCSTAKECLLLRVPPADFLCYDCSDLYPEPAQQQIGSVLRGISAHNGYYAKVFLKAYIRMLETHSEVCEDLYELYCLPEILGGIELPSTTPDILQYAIGATGQTVLIEETPKVISGAGTTGLRTWEAAIALMGFLSHLSLAFKLVMELGAGTGLVSLSLLKTKNVLELTVTDGNSALLENFSRSLELNELSSTARLSLVQLEWGTTNITKEEFVRLAPEAEVVVAADVTYDALVIPCLCDTLEDCFSRATTVAYVAATIRNPSTIAVWEKELDRRFTWAVRESLQDPHEDGTAWFRKATPPIKIYELLGVVSCSQ